MFRRGKHPDKTQGITGQIIGVFQLAHGSDRGMQGAVEGILSNAGSGTRVFYNRWCKYGRPRLIIGQIHATDDDQLRL